mmetsp:Transcript_21484/g.33106  ORF Transcript_21484/g.33106 Transcript_21484/m.33106 type:complete len:536 (-) Transcript_21484:55-1662(-)
MEELKPSETSCPYNEARTTLQKKILDRRSSLTEHECSFLHMLLVDEPKEEGKTKHTENLQRATKVLDDDILFTVPLELNAVTEVDGKVEEERTIPRANLRRPNYNFLGLWKAHEDGATKLLLKKGTEIKERRASDTIQKEEKKSEHTEDDQKDEDEDEDDCSVKSDEEVRKEKCGVDEGSEASSWNMEEGGFEHYDAWEVLKDEYAEDFGFDYGERSSVDEDSDNDDTPGRSFRILGTSVEDKSAQPHVLSPPLMEALSSFVPNAVSGENLWLKYSLVRDGASLMTLQRYARSSPHTIVAIETAKGDVFGSFTSSPWRANLGYYGSGESFLWRMRHNRMTPCHSLFEQAQLETEIDVYFYSNINSYIQLCTPDKIAIGGGELDTTGEEDHDDPNYPYGPVDFDKTENYGFGIALTKDLTMGTSSPCATFRSPCLVNKNSKGERFDVVNMEVWTFTPCSTIDEAEKNEMRKFFIQESVNSINSTTSVGSTYGATHSNWNTETVDQASFFRRVGEQDESEMDRDQWQYAAMTGIGRT